ncbi:MAG: metalloregulator ArsR/SmtB family transcription factor [Bacteroidota bacterium]
MDHSRIEYVARTFMLICHPDRERIIYLLNAHGQLNVTQIYEHLNLLQAETSHHLGHLLEHKIVKRIRKGKESIYSLNHELLEKIIKYSELLFSEYTYFRQVRKQENRKRRSETDIRSEQTAMKLNKQQIDDKYAQALAYLAELKRKKKGQ